MEAHTEWRVAWPHHSAHFSKGFFVRHCAVSANVVALPDEAQLVTSPLLHMLVQAIVAYIGLASLEELCEDFASPHIKVVIDVFVIPLHEHRIAFRKGEMSLLWRPAM